VKPEPLRKHLAIAFVAALGLYIIGFTWVEHRRSRLGPWEVSFIKEPQSPPVLRIQQHGLSVSDVEIELVGTQGDLPATNVHLSFEPGREVPFPVPFGQCVFMDPTFLPGTVTLEVLGQEIQMLPRILTVNGREHAWKPGLRVVAAR
jgi:hypothetical protein